MLMAIAGATGLGLRSLECLIESRFDVSRILRADAAIEVVSGDDLVPGPSKVEQGQSSCGLPGKRGRGLRRPVPASPRDSYPYCLELQRPTLYGKVAPKASE